MVLMEFLFIAFPYIAIIVCIAVSIYRYQTNQFSISSLSTQFMGSKELGGIGANLWHVGIFLILGGHFVSFFFTDQYYELKNSSEIAHYALEGMRIIAGIMVVVGLVLLIYRRLVNPRLRVITTPMDWIVLILLLLQVLLGWYIYLSHLSEPFWFSDNVAPWLRGVFFLNAGVPRVEAWYIGVHMLNPFLILLLIPFSRLIHMFTFPVTYVYRPYQIVVWNRRN